MLLEVHQPFLFLKKSKLRKKGILLKPEKLGNYSLIIPDDMIDFLRLTQGQKLYYIISGDKFIGYIYKHKIFWA